MIVQALSSVIQPQSADVELFSFVQKKEKKLTGVWIDFFFCEKCVKDI